MKFSNNLKNKIKSSYTENLVEEFYKPVLSEAILYQRVSGYFNSAGFDLYVDGLEELAKNGGRIEFIVSKTISKRDFEKIKAGYDLLEELKSLRLSERNEKLNTETQVKLGNLAFMIANGRAKVKIAFTEEGIFHDKFGIISSSDETIMFNGSANETYGGIRKNYESISVDVSWDNSEMVISRINKNKERFNRLWNNTEENVVVIEASDLTYEEIAKYQPQSHIIEIQNSEDDEGLIMNDCISFIYVNNTVIRQDNTVENITNTDRKLKITSDIGVFFENDNSTIKTTTSYKDIERIIDTTIKRATRMEKKVFVSDAVWDYVARNKYAIEQYKIIGDVYKNSLDDFPQVKRESFEKFTSIVQSEVSRPLYELHLRSAFYKYEMNRAANFSVPGAGKTAMVLGVFAYLNRFNIHDSEKIERMLVIAPISAFDSWKKEFKAVFGNKKRLRVIDCQSSKDFHDDLNRNWKISNLILVNYESLQKYTNQLERIIDKKTMLIFDEVHRIKNPNGRRAEEALKLVHVPRYKYVLTGTPIPNSYMDIYNFLHILYGYEYNSYFGWDLYELKDPRIRQIQEINEKLYPFFWRTNKKDLKVPDVDRDNIILVDPSEEQLELAKAIYFNETSSLAQLIRLMQASTNPSLVNRVIDYNELKAYDEEQDEIGITEMEFENLLGDVNRVEGNNTYSLYDVDLISSPKFYKGIELVTKLVSEGKKVLVWGIFVDTLQKIKRKLIEKGISVNLVYGSTSKNLRVELIDEFRDGNVQVLVTNPQTLSESISLHQTVHDAVYFEFDYNLTFMLQSRDRIHRLGLQQNQYTRYHYLLTKSEDIFSYRPGFIDEKIYSRLKEKEQIMYEAIDDRTLSIEYSENEIYEAIKIIEEEKKRINKSIDNAK